MGCLPSKPLPRVLVLGASGFVGKATLSRLASKYGSHMEVFAGTRDTSKWEAMPGVTAVATDMAKKEALVETLKTFNRVFIVTPGTQDRTHMATNALEAAKEAGCEFVLLLSVLSCDTDTIFGKQFQPLEARCQELGFPSHTIIRVPLFLDNMMLNVPSIKNENTFYDPRDPSKPHTLVAVQDIAKAAAAILAHPDPTHRGKLYKLVSPPPCTLNDQAAELSAALGRAIQPTTVHYNAAKESFLSNEGAAFEEWQVLGVLELFHMIDEESPVTNEAHTTDLESITGEKATTLKDWVEQNKAAFQ